MTGPRIPKGKPDLIVRDVVRDILAGKMTVTKLMAPLTPKGKDIIVAGSARDGDFELLVELLSSGEEIGPRTRLFLIEDFKTGKPRKRGNKKNWRQLNQDTTITLKVAYAMIDNQIDRAKSVALVAKSLNKHRATIASAVDRVEPNLYFAMPEVIDGKWEWPLRPVIQE